MAVKGASLGDHPPRDTEQVPDQSCRIEVIINSLHVSLGVFVVVFGSSMAGMLLRAIVPNQHLSAESKGVIQLGIGLVGTMAALVLGLLVASAKSSYDAQSTELTQASANIILLDRLLAHYGPETKEARETLRRIVVSVVEQTWSGEGENRSQFGSNLNNNENLFEEIQGLVPTSDLQRALKSQAFAITLTLGQTRWLMFEQGATSVSKPMLVVMVFWLAIIFISWGLFAPPNVTVVAALMVVALSVSGSIFLIMEMYSPYQGLIQISSAPLRAALAHLGQ
jgi:hypothetical protein